MRRTVATLGTTVLLTGLLAACSGQESADTVPVESSAPSSDATGSATPSASPNPTVTKPQRPPEMAKENADGAAAAAVYFMELWEYTMKSGDTSEWKAMSGSACDFCDNGLQQAERIAEKNHVYEGGEVTASALQTYKKDLPTGIWPVDVQTTMAPAEISTHSGEVVYSSTREVVSSRVEVAESDDGWVVITVADIPEDDR